MRLIKGHDAIKNEIRILLVLFTKAPPQIAIYNNNRTMFRKTGLHLNGNRIILHNHLYHTLTPITYSTRHFHILAHLCSAQMSGSRQAAPQSFMSSRLLPVRLVPRSRQAVLFLFIFSLQ